MDIQEMDKECRGMAGLFQELAHELKSSSSVWQDFTAKANKLHQTLSSSTSAISSYLDALQKIADMATNSKGAVKDIGATLTRLCLRQRSVEEKMKQFALIMGGTFSPIPGLLDDWKKCVVQMDQSHAKDFKKVDKEIQRSVVEVSKLKKQIEKGNKKKLQPSLESKERALQFKYNDLLTNESVALKKLTLHQRQRFSFFVKCLLPLLDKQNEMLGELCHLDDVTQVLTTQTKDSESIIKYCEDFVDDFRSDDSCRTFVTPPTSPQLSRHSSSLSIRSNRRPMSSDRNSEYSFNASIDAQSTISSIKLPDDETTPTNTPLASHKTTEVNGGYGMTPPQNTEEENTLRRKPSQKSSFFSNLKSSNTSLSKNSRKSFSGRPFKDQVEDSDVMMGHRRDHSTSIQSLSRHSLLESPLRPGSVRYEASQDLKRAALSPNDYATLGRNGHRSFNPLRSSFMGTSYSHAARLHDTSLPSPPPPPPILNESHINNFNKSKKSLAPLPPRISSMKPALQAQQSLPITRQHQPQQIPPKTAPPLRPPPFSKSPIPPQRHSTQLKQQSPPALQHSPQQFVQQNLSQQQQQQPNSIYSVPHQQKLQQPQFQQNDVQQQQIQNNIDQQHYQQQVDCEQLQQTQNPQQSLLPEQQLQLQKLNQEIHSHVINQQTSFPVSPTPKTSTFKLNQQQKSLAQQTFQETHLDDAQQNVQQQVYTPQQQQLPPPQLQQKPQQQPQKSSSPQPTSPRSATQQPKLVITLQNHETTSQPQQQQYQQQPQQTYQQQQQLQQTYQQQQQQQAQQRPKYVPYSIKNNTIITDIPTHTTSQNTNFRTSFCDVTSPQQKSFFQNNSNNTIQKIGSDVDNSNNNNANNNNNVENVNNHNKNNNNKNNNGDDDNDVPIRILKKYDEGLSMKSPETNKTNPLSPSIYMPQKEL